LISQPKIKPASHSVDIAGESVELPLVAIRESLAVPLLMVIDMGVGFGDRIGRALADRLMDKEPDIIVGAATLGIPVAIEVSRQLKLDRYVILQKSPKIHLRDALVESVQSVTSVGSQRLLLDRRAMPLMAGKRVALVDDVVATGSSLRAMLKLTRQASAKVVGIGVILTEGHDWREALGADAGLVTALGHIPRFRIAGGLAEPDPATLAHC